MSRNQRWKYIITLFISREIILIAMKHERSCGSRRISKFCACAVKFVFFTRNDKTTDYKWMQRFVRSPMSGMRNHIRTPTGNLLVYLIFLSRFHKKIYADVDNLIKRGDRASTREEKKREGKGRLTFRTRRGARVHPCSTSHPFSSSIRTLLVPSYVRAYIHIQRVCP